MTKHIIVVSDSAATELADRVMGYLREQGEIPILYTGLVARKYGQLEAEFRADLYGARGMIALLGPLAHSHLSSHPIIDEIESLNKSGHVPLVICSATDGASVRAFLVTRGATIETPAELERTLGRFLSRIG